ncbi:MAG TPA: ABC transporter ATP-binding protein/permease [Firmicutes bacterium]|nr:ABC transporter ATP-binding protein/permease [Bacillota bacterium]
MKKLLIYLKDYKIESVLAPLFKMLEALFELFVPIVMAKVIDIGIPAGDRSYVIRMCLVMILLGIIGLVCSITAQYFSAKAACGFATKLRHSLFEHIQSLSFTEMDTVGTSTLITRMTSDINQVQNGVNMFLRLFMRSPFIVVGAMVAAFIIDVRSAIIFAVAIPLLSVIVFIIMYVSIPLYKKVQSRLDTVLGITRENLTGARVIRAFHKEEGETERFEEANGDLSSLQIFVGKISALMNPATYAVVNLAIVAIIWVGGIRVNTGAISQGEVVALINYMSQILVELIKLANLIVLINKAIACGNRVQSVFEISSSMSESPDQSIDTETDNAVEFKDVSLRYGSSETDSLSEITFSAKKGETIGIIGGTGSGKSSIVNMIPRFYDAFSGEVLVDGKNVKDYSIKALRGKIGVVPQKAVLFNGTIRENLLWGNENASDEDIYEALKISQAIDVVEGRRKGLDSEVAQGGKNFSGGQRQRLTIARALVRKPEILILDDSASALDFATDAALRKAIREMENSPTVFIVSQRASSIQYADKIIVLDDGRIAGIGSHDSLLESCGVYQEIYYSQFPKNRKED